MISKAGWHGIISMIMYSQQDMTISNSHAMMDKVGTWNHEYDHSQSQRCHNIQLTTYDYQGKWMMVMKSLAWSWSPRCWNINSPTMIDREWYKMNNHEHDHSHQYVNIYNSQPINGGRGGMKWSAWLPSLTYQNTWLTSYGYHHSINNKNICSQFSDVI